jgi:ribosomal protein S12 methylthiotransferase accessory factor YcaO
MELTERTTLMEAIDRNPSRLLVRDGNGRAVAVVPASSAFPGNPDRARFRWALSSGVAAGTSWEDAARRARWELIERDRVLRSWYGRITPNHVGSARPFVPDPLRSDYDFEAFTFDVPDSDAVVCGVFGLPSGDAPLTYGFAARATRAAAIEVAAGEAIQRLGFLWGETLPSRPPEAVSEPDFHQEYYLCRSNHVVIRRWLSGAHARHSERCRMVRAAGEPHFADLSAFCDVGGVFVAKALPRGHVPLGFGIGHPLFDPLPPELSVHPIV